MVLLTERRTHMAQALVVVATEYPRRLRIASGEGDAELPGTASRVDAAVMG
jgi:hypothetical protein